MKALKTLCPMKGLQIEMKCHPLAVSSFISLFALASLSSAEAQMTFSLSPTVTQIARGQQFEFTGTLFNNSNDSYFLTSSSGLIKDPDNSTNGSSVTLNDDDFVSNFPSVFSPNDQYSGKLLVNVASDAPLGDYVFIYSVTGEKGGTPVSFTGNARLTVIAAGVPSPEASLIMLCGMGGVIALRRRRKNAHKN